MQPSRAQISRRYLLVGKHYSDAAIFQILGKTFPPQRYCGDISAVQFLSMICDCDRGRNYDGPQTDPLPMGPRLPRVVTPSLSAEAQDFFISALGIFISALSRRVSALSGAATKRGKKIL